MKIILLVVSSINGKITRGNEQDIYKWTSSQDQDIYFEKINRAKLIIMGRKTYEQARHLMKHNASRTRVVMTRNPKKYVGVEVPHILEFTSDTPAKIVERFEKHGIREALVVGGRETNHAFLEAGLVNELHVTLEPHIFGAGKNMFQEKLLDVSVKLKKTEVLNKKGTVLLMYKVEGKD